MDSIDWLRVQRNWRFLLESLDIEQILPFLYQQCVINEEEMEMIKNDPSYNQRSKLLLKTLKTKENGYSKLCEVLRQQQPFIIQKLNQTIIDDNDYEKFRIQDKLASILLDHFCEDKDSSVDLNDIMFAIEKKLGQDIEKGFLIETVCETFVDVNHKYDHGMHRFFHLKKRKSTSVQGPVCNEKVLQRAKESFNSRSTRLQVLDGGRIQTIGTITDTFAVDKLSEEESPKEYSNMTLKIIKKSKTVRSYRFTGDDKQEKTHTYFDLVGATSQTGFNIRCYMSRYFYSIYEGLTYTFTNLVKKGNEFWLTRDSVFHNTSSIDVPQKVLNKAPILPEDAPDDGVNRSLRDAASWHATLSVIKGKIIAVSPLRYLHDDELAILSVQLKDSSGTEKVTLFQDNAKLALKENDIVQITQVYHKTYEGKSYLSTTQDSLCQVKQASLKVSLEEDDTAVAIVVNRKDEDQGSGTERQKRKLNGDQAGPASKRILSKQQGTLGSFMGEIPIEAKKKHNQLFVTLNDLITKDSFWSIQRMAHTYIDVKTVTKVNSMDKLLSYLERKGVIGVGKYDVLMQIMRDAGVVIWMDEIRKTAKDIKDIMQNHISSQEQSGTSSMDAHFSSEDSTHPSPGEASTPHIPEEIQSMPPEAVELYTKILKTGVKRKKDIRLMLVGLYNTGKTSLARRLMGQDIQNIESTDGIHIYRGRCKISLHDGSWTTSTSDLNEDAASRLARLAVDTKILESEDLLTENTAVVSKANMGRDDSSDKNSSLPLDKVRVDNGAETSDDTSPIDEPQFSQTRDLMPRLISTLDPSDIRNIRSLEQHLKSSTPEQQVQKQDEAIVNLWDFAGQFTYYSTHQLFLSPRAIYIVVFKLNEDMEDLITNDVWFMDARGRKGLHISAGCIFWLKSICHYGQGRSMLRNVILVGTHKDQLEGSEDDKKRKIEKTLDCIRHMLTESEVANIIHDETFEVSNLVEDQNIPKLRQAILDVAKSQVSWNEELPAKWIQLEGRLMDERAKKKFMLSFQDLLEIDRSCSNPMGDEDQLKLFLIYQTQIGNLIFINEYPLQDTIVLDPQWTADAFCSAVADKQFAHKFGRLRDDWTKMMQTAKMEESLLARLWSEKNQQDFVVHQKKLIQYLEKLNMIAKIKVISDDGQEEKELPQYFIPCLLKECPEEAIKYYPNEECCATAILCFEFKGQFLPPAVFHRLLSACIAKWSVARQGKKFLLFCGYGMFEIGLGSNRCRLTIHQLDDIIAVRMFSVSARTRTLDAKCCVEVRHFIEVTLNREFQRFRKQSHDHEREEHTKYSCSEYIGGERACHGRNPFEQKILCPIIKDIHLISDSRCGLICVQDVVSNHAEEHYSCVEHSDMSSPHDVKIKDILQHWFPDELASLGFMGEPEDPTPYCNKCAKTSTSNSYQEVTTEDKVEKFKRNPNLNSATYHQAMTLPRSLYLLSGLSSGNMRAQFDETDAVCNQRLLVDLAKSVGIIKSPHGISATGFRVGPDYIMTAKHVKDDILNAVPFQLNELSQPSPIIHLSHSSIDFSHEVKDLPAADNLKFYFEPEIVYENEEMDTVILRLKSNTLMEYPPPLTCFAELSNPCSQLYFIGHSGADIKKTDKFHHFQLNYEEITAAEEWSFNYVGRNGFKGINNSRRVLFHCTFEKGASGSPGVCIYHENNQTHARIVTMLLCGYPDWYYDTNCSQEKKAGTPPQFCVEQGVCMKSLSEDMKVTKPDLWWEIFSYNFNDDDDVEMKSM